MHVTGLVPARIAAELERDFDVADEAAGADGVLALLSTTVDDAYLDAAGPQLKVVANYGVGVNNVDLDAARRRGVVIAEHAGRPHEDDGRARDHADALADAARHRGRPDAEAARPVAVLARVHARREPRRQDALHRRPRQDRPRDRAARRGVRRDDDLRGPRRRAGGAARPGRRRQPPLSADGRDAPPDRRRRARADEADGGARQHRPRPGRRRGGARARASRRARSPVPRSTSSSSSRR